MTEAAPHKAMTEGEAGLVMAFSILALLALAGAAKAEDTAFAFHAYLTAAASVAVVFGIQPLLRSAGRAAAAGDRQPPEL
jgi:cytochrome c oxidase cbb3-type subunit I